jgi:hypothetical protein
VTSATLWTTVIALTTLSLVGCSNQSTSSGSTTTPPVTPPATSDQGVAALVAGPPSLYQRIEVSAGVQHAVVPANLVTQLAPLLIARDLGPAASLAEFGLDRVTATLTYIPVTATAPTVISIGNPDFDHHGFYATRSGNPRVYLVLSDGVRPALALVGDIVAAPTS